MRPHPALFTQRIIWFALLASIFMHAGIAYTILNKQKFRPEQASMPAFLAGLALIIVVVSFILPKTIYRQAAKATNVKIAEQAAPNAFPGRYREAMPKQAVFDDPNARSYAFASHTTPFIISLALSEAVGLFGLVLTQLGFDMPTTLPFFIAGAVLITIRFPREAKILEMYEEAHGATFPAENS